MYHVHQLIMEQNYIVYASTMSAWLWCTVCLYSHLFSMGFYVISMHICISCHVLFASFNSNTMGSITYSSRTHAPPPIVFRFTRLVTALVSSSLSYHFRVRCNSKGHYRRHIVRSNPYGASPVFSGVRVARSLVFCVVFCGSLFVLLFFFSSSLCCLSFFETRILNTSMVSSYSSWDYIISAI